MKIRTIPALGFIFGILLALIVLTSAGVYEKTTDLRDRSIRAQNDYQHVAELLGEVRSDIARSMFAVQNYLLDPAEDSRVRALDEVAQAREASSLHLQQLEHHFESSVGSQLRALVGKLNQHWLISVKALQSVSAGEPASYRLSEGTAALAEALQMTRDMDALNLEELRAQDRLTAGRSRSFGRFLFWITCTTFTLGLLVSIAALVAMRRRERESARQTRKALDAETALRQLSQQLLRAQEEERKNISRELHDEVGQLITGLRIELGNVQRGLGENKPLAARIQEAKSLTEQSLRSIRNMAMLLRPSMLDDQGLAPSIQWQAKEFSRRFEVPVVVGLEGDLDRIPSGHGVCLYRVIQEVLTNCAKHAQAHRITINVKAREHGVLAKIVDDGVGFMSPTPAPANGIGLLGVAERIRELNGNLSISSSPGRGTSVDVELPFHPSDIRHEAYRSPR